MVARITKHALEYGYIYRAVIYTSIYLSIYTYVCIKYICLVFIFYYILFIAGSTSRFSNGAARLADGPFVGAGRVEIFFANAWHTVCDDGWDTGDANVLCKQLGYSRAISAPGSAKYGQGTGGIILDDIECSSSDATLFDCSHDGLFVENCSHREDAGAFCI